MEKREEEEEKAKKIVKQHSLFYKFDYLLEIIYARPTENVRREKSFNMYI